MCLCIHYNTYDSTEEGGVRRRGEELGSYRCRRRLILFFLSIAWLSVLHGLVGIISHFYHFSPTANRSDSGLIYPGLYQPAMSRLEDAAIVFARQALTSTATAATTAIASSGSTCDSGNGYDGKIGLRISAIFVILAGSLFGMEKEGRIRTSGLISP